MQCPGNLRRDKQGKCRCPRQLPYYHPGLRRCVATNPRLRRPQQVQRCPANTVRTSQGRCRCPKDLPRWSGTLCIRPPIPTCKSNLVRTKSGRCRCPSSAPYWNGSMCTASKQQRPRRGGNVVFTIDEASCKDENGQWIQGYNNRSIYEDLVEWSAKATELYNKYTRLQITSVVSYGAEDWRTSNGGWNWGAGEGRIIMGNNRNLEIFLHEFAHVVCTRYYDQWNALTGDGGVWTGDRVNRIMKKFDGPDAVMHVDNITHFWPYGFIESRAMPYGTHIRHAIIVQAFYDDMTNLLCPDTSTRWNPDTNSCQDTNS